ncbi:MAG: hypothetical protein EXS15_04375 [Phycisphaerales bacterium]|nr:hypothetical protein [Phycisphaerales bacterium]
MRVCQTRPTLLILALAPIAITLATVNTEGADCTVTSTGLTPLNAFAPGELYLGLFAGGLYPNASNQLAGPHLARGLTAASQIKPLGTDGQPSTQGKIVLMSIGMSNTTQEWCGAANPTLPCGPTSFSTLAHADDSINWNTLVVADGAKSGQTSQTWDSPTDPNYDRVRDQVLSVMGLTEAQVQVVWVKSANAGPTVKLPASNADAFALKGQLGNISRAIKTRYPNARLVFLSSRIYAGYASTTLNPEPYAYEGAFGVKWLIQAQMEQAAGGAADPIAGDLSPAVAPHVSWGPYLWSDGMTPGVDGVRWECADLTSDGTHPSTSGREKVARKLLAFFAASPLCAEWYRAVPPPVADLNNDGLVNGSDLTILFAQWGTDSAVADLDRDGIVAGSDLALVLGAWGS